MSIEIGKLIAEKLEASGMSKSEFSRRIHRARQNVNDILGRNSVDCDMLFSISKALNYNFFQHYALELTEDFEIQEPSSEYSSLRGKVSDYEKRLAELEKDFNSAMKEVELLKEIVSLLKENKDKN